jgi:DNA-binding winged helix-turn-helix (wHTH) protein
LKREEIIMGRRLALLIGNTTFDNPKTFPMLHTPANDIRDFARVLREYGSFEILNTLLDETSGIIDRAIDDLFSEAERGDLVLLYYSGHGYRGRTGNYYLASRNSHPKRMRSTSVPAFFIHDVMKSSRSRHKLIILDCCFSGAFIKDRKGGVREPVLLTEMRGEAEAILASSGIVEYSFEEEGPNSLFTQYLIQGIETGKADQNGDGQISIDELFDYADERVRKARPGQTPMKEVSIRESEIVIATSPKGPMGGPTVDIYDSFHRTGAIELNFPNPVQDEKDFYGRQADLERIEQVLLSENHKPVIVLGERRIGKTSLQLVTSKRVTTRGEGRFVPLLLPPASAIHSFEDYAREMLQSLCSYLGKGLHEAGLTDEKGRIRMATIGQFMDAIASLLDGAPEKSFIVCVDEFDAVLRNCNAAEADRILALTEHISERSGLPLFIYFTMTRLPETMISSLPSPLISKSESVELGPFSRSETVEMVTGLLEDQVVLEDAAMERLLHLSGGHPYFVKLLLDHLLTRHGKGPGLIISQQMLEQVIPEAARDPRARHALDNIYKVHFTRPERQLALLLAERGAGIADEELRVLGAEFVTAAKRLERRGYLTLREGLGYAFRVQFLGRWLGDWEEFEEEMEALNITETRRRLGTEIEIDEAKKQVYIKGTPVKLTPQEYQVLAFLGSHAGHVVSKDQLAQELWPEAEGDVNDAAIDAAISRLRRKLDDDARHPRYLETIAGQGVILHRAAFVQPGSDFEGGSKP